MEWGDRRHGAAGRADRGLKRRPPVEVAVIRSEGVGSSACRGITQPSGRSARRREASMAPPCPRTVQAPVGGRRHLQQRAAVAASLPSLVAQLDPGTSSSWSTTAPADDTLSVVRELAPAATVIESGGKRRLRGGRQRGRARWRSGDLLVFLNPDAMPAPGFAEAIRRRCATTGTGPPGWVW